MGRTSQPGISYFPVQVDMVSNTKIKLLHNDCGPAGVWVYWCLLAESYKSKGYYLDLTDEDFLTLFSSDVCKLPISDTQHIIAQCVKRGLFNKVIYDSCKVLTTDRMQETYLEATKERRRKGTQVVLQMDYLLIEIDSVKDINVIIHGKNRIVPRNIPDISAALSPKEKKGEEKRGEERGKAAAPVFESVISYCVGKGLSDHKAKKFYEHYSTNGWKDKNERSVLPNWQLRADEWAIREQGYEAEKPKRNGNGKAKIVFTPEATKH